MKHIIVLLILLIFTSHLFSQEYQHKQNSDHHNPMLEFGVSGALVYNFTEEELASGIHVHLIKPIGKGEKLGLGLGYEAIFDDHKHNSASAIIEYRVTEHLVFNFAPGVSWLATEANSAKPSMHIESIYSFELGKFHLGPLIGVAFNSEDLHASAGLHLAIGF